MSEIKIEKEVPIPAKTQKVRKYPFVNMEVGDSFFVKFKDEVERMRLVNSIHACAPRYKPKRFTIRTIRSENGIRCWRIN